MMQTPGQVVEEEGSAGGEDPAANRLESNSASSGMWLVIAAGVGAAFLSLLTDAALPLQQRVGGSWFASSWLPEILRAVVWRQAGSIGLALLHAGLMGASLLAVWDLARRDRWTLWGTRLVLAMHVLLWGIVQPATIPELALAIALPMAWSAALRLRDGTWGAGTLMAALAATLAVNSHRLFPLGMLPVAFLLADHRQASPHALWRFVAATLLGWCATPNLRDLPSIGSLNVARAALAGGGAAIREHEPGFVWLAHAPAGMLLVTLLLLVLPLLPASMGQHAGRLRWLTMAWLAGLLLFTLAAPGLLLWWLLALPLVAATMGAIPRPTRECLRRVLSAAWWCVLLTIPLQTWPAQRSRNTTYLLAALQPLLQVPRMPSTCRWSPCSFVCRTPACTL